MVCRDSSGREPASLARRVRARGRMAGMEWMARRGWRLHGTAGLDRQRSAVSRGRGRLAWSRDEWSGEAALARTGMVGMEGPATQDEGMNGKERSCWRGQPREAGRGKAGKARGVMERQGRRGVDWRGVPTCGWPVWDWLAWQGRQREVRGGLEGLAWNRSAGADRRRAGRRGAGGRHGVTRIGRGDHGMERPGRRGMDGATRRGLARRGEAGRATLGTARAVMVWCGWCGKGGLSGHGRDWLAAQGADWGERHGRQRSVGCERTEWSGWQGSDWQGAYATGSAVMGMAGKGWIGKEGSDGKGRRGKVWTGIRGTAGDASHGLAVRVVGRQARRGKTSRARDGTAGMEREARREPVRSGAAGMATTA